MGGLFVKQREPASCFNGSVNEVMHRLMSCLNSLCLQDSKWYAKMRLEEGVDREKVVVLESRQHMLEEVDIAAKLFKVLLRSLPGA